MENQAKIYYFPQWRWVLLGAVLICFTFMPFLVNLIVYQSLMDAFMEIVGDYKRAPIHTFLYNAIFWLLGWVGVVIILKSSDRIILKLNENDVEFVALSKQYRKYALVQTFVNKDFKQIKYQDILGVEFEQSYWWGNKLVIKTMSEKIAVPHAQLFTIQEGMEIVAFIKQKIGQK